MTLLHSLRMIFRLAAAAALLAVAEAGPSFTPGRAADRAQLGSSALTGTPRLQNFARTPLCFDANQGQTHRQVAYPARAPPPSARSDWDLREPRAYLWTPRVTW